MQIAAYVLSKNGIPLMPAHSYGKVRRLLKSKRARVVSLNPFTIQLKYETPDIKRQEEIGGVKPGNVV